MIKTENLTKVYASGTKAVDDLSFEVVEGEIFGFLGQNGAGKSTAIKILTTLAKPSEGRAWVNGYDVMKDPFAVRKSIGYVAQESGVDYFMTGRENLTLQGRMYRMDGKTIHHRVEQLLALFGLTREADHLVSTYSGGMRRKLDIATALIHEPKILFLDEPTLGLDPHSRSNLWDHIRQLNRDLKVTLFLTTHYLDEADKLSHRIGILHRGSLKIVDTPDALKNSICGDSVNFSFDQEDKEKAQIILKQHPLVRELLPENEHLRVYVDRGSEAIPVLMSTLSEQGIMASSVTLSRPTLDDVYLKYSGVSFKDDSAGVGEANPWWAKWQKKGGWSGKKWGNWDESGQSEQGETTVEGQVSQRPESPAKNADPPHWEEEWKKWNPESKSSESEQKTAVPAQWSNPDWGSGNGNGEKNGSEHSGAKPWEKWQTSEPNQGSEKKEEGDSSEKAEWAKWQDQWKQKKG